MNKPIRIIAWGNDGRGDDGVALKLLDRLERIDWKLPDQLHFEAHHQLGPEVAVNISASRLVIFIDAHVDEDRPDLTWERVLPLRDGALDSHHCTPSVLLGLCDALNWPTPPCFQLAMRAYCCNFGDQLSGQTRKLLARGERTVIAVIERCISDASLSESPRPPISIACTAIEVGS